MNNYQVHKVDATRFKDFIKLRVHFQQKVMFLKTLIQHNSRYKGGDTIKTHSCNQNLFDNSNQHLLDMYYFFDDTLEKNIVIIECCEILTNLKFIPKTTEPNEEGQFGTIEFVLVNECSEEDIQNYKNGLGCIIEIVYD
jgi:hypothetical protein